MREVHGSKFNMKNINFYDFILVLHTHTHAAAHARVHTHTHKIFIKLLSDLAILDIRWK